MKSRRARSLLLLFLVAVGLTFAWEPAFFWGLDKIGRLGAAFSSGLKSISSIGNFITNESGWVTPIPQLSFTEVTLHGKTLRLGPFPEEYLPVLPIEPFNATIFNIGPLGESPFDAVDNYPSIFDVVLDSNCLIVIGPTDVNASHYLGDLTIRANQLPRHDFSFTRVMRSNDTEGSFVGTHCHPALSPPLNALDLRLTFTYPGSTVTVTRPRRVERILLHPPSDFGLMTMVNRGPDALLRSWLDYYWGIGVRHFYVYYNGNVTAFLLTDAGVAVEPFLQSGVLTIVEWNMRQWTRRRVLGSPYVAHAAQPAALQSTVQRYARRHKFMLWFDVDEYLIFNAPDATLHSSFLESPASTPEISLITNFWVSIRWNTTTVVPRPGMSAAWAFTGAALDRDDTAWWDRTKQVIAMRVKHPLDTFLVGVHGSPHSNVPSGRRHTMGFFHHTNLDGKPSTRDPDRYLRTVRGQHLTTEWFSRMVWAGMQRENLTGVDAPLKQE